MAVMLVSGLGNRPDSCPQANVNRRKPAGGKAADDEHAAQRVPGDLWLPTWSWRLRTATMQVAARDPLPVASNLGRF